MRNKQSWIYTFTTILALLILVGFSLISASIYASFTKTPLDANWWLTWGIGQVPPIGTFIVLLFYKDGKNISDEEYQTKEKIIRDAIKEADTTLNEFLNQYNRKTKTKAYIRKIRKKIARREYFIAWVKQTILYRFRKTRKLAERIIQGKEEKILLFKSRITPDYIKENIDFVWFVRYDKITRSMIGTGVNLNRERKTIENVSGFYGRSVVKKLFIAGIIQAVIASIVVQQILIGLNGQFWFNLITGLTNIFVQGFLAVRTADKGFENYRLHNQTNRISILKEYQDWRKELKHE